MEHDLGMPAPVIESYIATSFAGVNPIDAWGESSFFYNPERKLPRGVYFATIKSKDGDNDSSSKLNRSGVYRLNVGVSAQSYTSLFGERPARPEKGNVVETGHDFTAKDMLMPHPVYGWMSWICVLNPSESMFELVKPLLAEAYEGAVRKYEKRIRTM